MSHTSQYNRLRSPARLLNPPRLLRKATDEVAS
jgi:hypothetical protein